MKKIGYVVVLLILLILPLEVESLIKDGIFGIHFPETIFTQDQWFAFWGSYLGSIITVVVLFVTIQYNKKESKKAFIDYQIEQKYDILLRDLKEIHEYINLFDGCGIKENNIVYTIRIYAIRYYELMNSCEPILLEISKEYITLVKQIWSEYIIEIEKVPKSLKEVDVQEAINKYEEASKKIYTIKHSYINRESVLYDNVIKLIHSKRLEEKKKNFLL